MSLSRSSSALSIQSRKTGLQSLNWQERIIWLAKRRHWPMVEGIITQQQSGKQKVNIASVKDMESGQTLLMIICRANHLRIAEIILQFCPTINEFSKDGKTALHYAAQASNSEIVNLLLKKGANPQLASQQEISLPLHYSCQRHGGSMSVTARLLKSMPAECRLKPDVQGYYPICYAVLFGNIPLIRLLLSERRQEQVAWKEKETGNSLLHLATNKRDIATVKCLLVDGKMDVNVRNASGSSAMHLAAEMCDTALIRCLHQVGRASANLSDGRDKTPGHFVAEVGETSLLTFMIDRMDADSLMRTKDGSTLMHLAAHLGHDETVLALVKRGAPIHMANKDKKTPLHNAAEHGHLKVARILLENGAPIDARTKLGFTALHVAVLHDKPEFVELLIGLGASIDAKAYAMETPLHIAAKLNSHDCARMLLLSGADVNVRNKETGETPLLIASRFGHLDLVLLFLEEGANVKLLSMNDESPLHLAVRHCHHEVVEALLKFTTDSLEVELFTNMANLEGETALHMATEEPSTIGVAMAHALLESGANLLATTNLTLETPVHFAARCNNVLVLVELAKYMVNDYHFIANRQSKNGWSALLTAAYYGHEDVVQHMLDKEVRADVFDEHGLGALHLAATRGYIRCCELLLARKAFVNAKSKLGMTPLHLAAENGYADLVQTLIRAYGATIDALSLHKKTPLHLAAENGHLDVVKVLVALKANVRARDAVVGLPIHLAAMQNHYEVVKFFLNFSPDLAFSSTTQDGLLCSHLAAASGSVGVIRELMRFNRAIVIASRSLDTDSLPIHMAALKGNSEVVNILIDAGATPYEENEAGMTALHAAAINGHVNVLAAFRRRRLPCNIISHTNGLSPLHVAAFNGQLEAVRELLADIPADIRSRAPKDCALKEESLKKMVSLDHGFTALGFAAFAGHDAVVRLLLNSHGVDVETRSTTTGTTAMHLSSISGHLTICSLLLAKSPRQLNAKSIGGVNALMFAAQNGHTEMVSSFVGQGANVNSTDKLGWSPLLYAARFGQIDVVALLIELGASTSHKSRSGKTPLSLSAASGHIDVFYFLMKRNFDADSLLEDEEFVFDLMICGRANKLAAVEEFALVSQSPLCTSAILARRFRQLAITNKQHSKELIAAGRFCEKMSATLLEVAVSQSSAPTILQAIDSKGRQLIDVFLDDGLKTVMAKASVQRYLTDVWWDGNLGWSNWQLFGLFLIFLFCPPVMAYFVLPLPHKYHRIPVIRFIGYLVSHLWFIAVLIITVVVPLYPNSTRKTFFPTWNELVLLLWLGGNLTTELTNPSEMRFIRLCSLGLSAIAMALQVVAYFTEADYPEEADLTMYVRNQILSIPVLLAVEMILDFTALNHRFGPLIIILKYMMEEVEMLLVMLIIFFVGFWLQLNAIYAPVCPDLNPELTEGCICNSKVPAGCAMPLISLDNPSLEPGCRANTDFLGILTTNLQLLWMGLFHHGDYLWQTLVRNSPGFTIALTRVQFAIFHVVMVLVMLTLMIAVSAEVYERMHRRSDLEWKYGRAKIIRGMIKTAPTPPPLNLIVKPFMYMKALIKFRKGMCLSMSRAAYNLMLIEDAAGVFDADGDVEQTGTWRSVNTNKVAGMAEHLSRWLGRKVDIFFSSSSQAVDIAAMDQDQDQVWRGVSFYKRGHQHGLLKEVVNWQNVVQRYREIRADGDEEDVIIEGVGVSLSEMEDWQLALWLEMLEMENEDQQRERRTWLIGEFNSVIKT